MTPSPAHQNDLHDAIVPIANLAVHPALRSFETMPKNHLTPEINGTLKRLNSVVRFNWIGPVVYAELYDESQGVQWVRESAGTEADALQLVIAHGLRLAEKGQHPAARLGNLRDTVNTLAKEKDELQDRVAELERQLAEREAGKPARKAKQ